MLEQFKGGLVVKSATGVKREQTLERQVFVPRFRQRLAQDREDPRVTTFREQPSRFAHEPIVWI